jgi:hypothetical protein
VRQRSKDSEYPAIPSPVLADNFKKSMFVRTNRFYNSGGSASCKDGNSGAVEAGWVLERLVVNVFVVGVVPTGVSARLRAIENKLNRLIGDNGEIGRTVAKYPRQELVVLAPPTLSESPSRMS